MPVAAMHKIAETLGCSHMDVYEVSTFFTMYNRNKLGKFHIMLCATTPCMVCGAYDIMCAAVLGEKVEWSGVQRAVQRDGLCRRRLDAARTAGGVSVARCANWRVGCGGRAGEY